MPNSTHLACTANVAADLRGLVGRLRRRLREQADAGDLKPSQVAVLRRLERDGHTTTAALARAEGMRPQSMATIVSALEAAGMVIGAPDPTDKRRVLLSLTDNCREWIKGGRAARQDWLASNLESRFSADEIAILAAATGLLRRLVDD